MKIYKTAGIIAICSCLVLLPFVQRSGIFHYSSSIIVGTLLMLGALFLFAYLPSANKWQINVIDIVVFLFLIISSIGKIETYDPLIIIQTTGLLIIYIGFRSFKSNNLILFVLLATLLACFLQSVYGILQYTEWMEPNHPFQFLTGSFLNQNFFAAYICIGMVVCLGLLLYGSGIRIFTDST